MSSRPRTDRPGPDARAASYPRKYWWVVLVALPVVLALIQFRPWSALGAGSGGGISDNQFNAPAILGNVSVVINQAQQAGASLDDGLISLLNEATTLAAAGRHGEAAARIEKVRASSREVAALPALANGAGAEHLAAGDVAAARAAFEQVITADPGNRLAAEGLRRLPPAPIKGVTLANYSSQYAGYARAANIVDEDPGSNWISGQVPFPHSFVLELPYAADIAELGFNNAASVAEQATKDVEISISADSATSGYEVVAKTALRQGEIGQGVRVNGTARGRWVKLRILSNYGDPKHTELGDVQVIGRPLSR